MCHVPELINALQELHLAVMSGTIGGQDHLRVGGNGSHSITRVYYPSTVSILRCMLGSLGVEDAVNCMIDLWSFTSLQHLKSYQEHG